MDIKEPLLGMTLTELKAVASQTALPSYAAAQIADWLYKKKVHSIEEMTNISASNREALSEQYEVGMRSPVEAHTSTDDATKYVFTVSHGRHSVETVHIPSKERDTLCVSSQAGCKMNCLFCMTGKKGFAANLTSNEIMNQIQSVPENEQLSNIVFMGMGEPLDNIDPLFKTLEILTAPYGYAWSPKRITVSTSGILPGLKRFLDESACHLAISLHSPHHDERLSLMPVEKAYHIDSIIDLLHQYDFTHQRRVSFEYIMFHSLNDSDHHAKDLARLLNGIECRVNLIRFHAIPGVNLTTSSDRRIEQFRDTLCTSGVTTTIRASRGEDIFAACGMLSN